MVKKILVIGDRLRRHSDGILGSQNKVAQLSTSNAAHLALAAMLVTGLAVGGGISLSGSHRQAASNAAGNAADELQVLKARVAQAEAAAASAESKLLALTTTPTALPLPPVAPPVTQIIASGQSASAQTPFKNMLSADIIAAQEVHRAEVEKVQAVQALRTVQADRDQLRVKLDEVQRVATIAVHDREQLAKIVTGERKQLKGKLAELRFRLVKSGHPVALAEEAKTQIGATSGFNVRTFLAHLGVRAPAEGGPFVAFHPGQNKADPAAEKILRSLPLRAPLDSYRLESEFGARVDPINGRESFHPGLDLSGPYRTPVFNTAPGVVVYAGYESSYGKLVEIDHGNGVHTKYAHLNRIMVNVGQHLSAHTRIGLLGSTGRSTGPHVHYEVTVNGIPQNPEKFLSVGKVVLTSAR